MRRHIKKLQVREMAMLNLEPLNVSCTGRASVLELCTSTPFVRPSDRKIQAVLEDSPFEASAHHKPNTSQLEVSSIIEQSSASVECQDVALSDRPAHMSSVSVGNMTTASASMRFDEAFVASSSNEMESICSVSCSDKQTNTSQPVDQNVSTSSSECNKSTAKEVESAKLISNEKEASESSTECEPDSCTDKDRSSDSIMKESETTASSVPQSFYLSDGQESVSKPPMKTNKRMTRVSFNYTLFSHCPVMVNVCRWNELQWRH